MQMSVFTCLVPDNSQLTLALRVDSFDPHSAFKRWVSHYERLFFAKVFIAVYLFHVL